MMGERRESYRDWHYLDIHSHLFLVEVGNIEYGNIEDCNIEFDVK